MSAVCIVGLPQGGVIEKGVCDLRSGPALPAVSPGSWRLQEDKLISPDARTLELTQQEYRLVELLMRNRNEVCSKLDLHACLFSHESEPDLHRIDVVVSRLRHKARQQGIHLPVRAIFGKGLAFIS